MELFFVVVGSKMSDRRSPVSLEASATEQVIPQQQQQKEHQQQEEHAIVETTNEIKTQSSTSDSNKKNEIKFMSTQTNEDSCKGIGSKKHRKRKRQYNQHHNNKSNKKWNKQFKQQQQRQNQHPTANKSDGENSGGCVGLTNTNNSKNLNSGRKNSYGPKSLRSIFKFVSRRHRGGVSKFFLSDKRPRKELIIPPTKFLLGGNISDPLNLNSLQDEALNASMNAATPKSSPITTPPKIDVIIPPNICDPLHLMDPVDSVEYENLLISPVPRRMKHRQRKKKPRKRHDSSMSSVPATASTADCSGGENDMSVTTTDDEDKCDETTQKKDSNSVADESHEAIVTTVIAVLADRKDLHLDLSLSAESAGGRKRRTSEGQPSNKNKIRRLESMDKIVSPVIPQPGAWKRPPQILPMGAPKNRHRATSTSITDESSNNIDLDKSATEDVEHQQQPMEQAQIKNPPPDTDQSSVSSSLAAPTDVVAIIQSTAAAVDEIIKNEENERQEKKPIFKKENIRYQFGNYSRYFGYKILDDFMDVRLIIFKRNSFLFKDKDILDIGCNSGHLTIAIAKKLHPKSILGIDIDENLVFNAKRNLSMYVRIPREQAKEPSKTDDEKKKKGTTNLNRKNDNKKCKEHTRKTDAEYKQHPEQRKRGKGNAREMRKSVYYPISFPICYGKMPRKSDIERIGKQNDDDNDDEDDDLLPVTVQHNENDKEMICFPNNVSFKKHNYVLSDEAKLSADVPQFDLILCLSTTKWIHLNFGDAGLKLAFKRMFNQLRPGGKLILEAQNWASYKKKKNLTVNNNYIFLILKAARCSEVGIVFSYS